MICLTCRDFHRVFPGQTPPPHDCFFGDPIEQLHVLTLTTSELCMTERALEFLALLKDSDDTADDVLVEILGLRRRLLDSLQGVEA